MVTSKSSRCWIFPKGHSSKGLSIKKAAEFEALEEAGIEGMLSPNSIGSYEYTRLGTTYEVKAYALKVEVIHDKWEEMHTRERRWMSVREAIEMASDENLKQLIKNVQDGQLLK